jgi:hypothetical protein
MARSDARDWRSSASLPRPRPTISFLRVPASCKRNWARTHTNSYSASVETFRLYVWQRQEGLAERLAFYAEPAHRRRRWKSYLKSQQSEEKLYQKLKAIHKKSDSRTLVLAYGSWGLVAADVGLRRMRRRSSN